MSSKTKLLKINAVDQKKGINHFVKREVEKLEATKKKSRIVWTTITSLMGLCNIIIVITASYALAGISMRHAGADVLIPASLVCLITIMLFIMGFVLAFYQNLKQDHKYKKAIDTIQNEYMKFMNTDQVYKVENENERAQLLKNQIEEDLIEIFKVRKKLKPTKIILKALIGDKDD